MNLLHMNSLLQIEEDYDDVTELNKVTIKYITYDDNGHAIACEEQLYLTQDMQDDIVDGLKKLYLKLKR